MARHGGRSHLATTDRDDLTPPFLVVLLEADFRHYSMRGVIARHKLGEKSLRHVRLENE
jgi:hypothetical protein